MALIRFLRNLKSKDSHSGLVLLSAAPILTIFSHGQDYILSAFVLGLVLLQVNLKQNVSRIHQICVPISLGLLVNWTNPSLPQAFLIYTFLIMILRFFLNAKPTLILVSILIFAISTSINAYLHSQGGDIQYLAYNFQALIFGICVFASYVQLESLKSNKAMNS
jgi:hypothetical protein